MYLRKRKERKHEKKSGLAAKRQTKRAKAMDVDGGKK